VSYLLKLTMVPLEVTPFEFCRDLWHQKTRIPGLSSGIVCMILCLAVSVEHRLVRDRQDGQTHDNGMYRTSMASCGKNTSTITIITTSTTVATVVLV